MSRVRPISAGILCILAAGTATATTPARAGDEGFREYAVKSAFIYNTLKFADWPHGGSALNLCILGPSPFDHELSAFDGKPVKDRTLHVKKIHAAGEARDCQAVLIPGAESDKLAQILKSLPGQGSLTLGDTDGFGQRGVMVNFFLDGNKVRFEANLDSARKAKIRFDSRLLKLAKIVSDKPD